MQMNNVIVKNPYLKLVSLIVLIVAFMCFYLNANSARFPNANLQIVMLMYAGFAAICYLMLRKEVVDKVEHDMALNAAKEKFKKDVAVYREKIIHEFYQRQGDSGYSLRSIFSDLVESYGKLSPKYRAEALFSVYDILSRPFDRDDTESRIALSSWMNGIAVELVDKLKEKGGYSV